MAIGTVAYDTASLTGETADAGGTVTYYVEKGDATCSVPGATSSAPRRLRPHRGPNSNTYTFTDGRHLLLLGRLLGRRQQQRRHEPCDSETVVVDKNTPAITTQVKDNADDTDIANGATWRSARSPTTPPTLTGETADAGGNVTYYVEKGDATCSVLERHLARLQDDRRVPNSNTYTFTDGRHLLLLGRLLG